MVSDDCLVECKIDDDSDEEQINTPPPPPEFASKASTPAPELPAPPMAPPMAPAPPTPTPTRPVDRDPYGINQHLKVSDVLAEPATLRSIDQVWLHSVAGFETTRIWTYRCLSLLLAVPFALLCGVCLAVVACLHVWYDKRSLMPRTLMSLRWSGAHSAIKCRI
uniref:Caveolin n=1 Tax=Cyclopterus lumpus TaxID=8103 RepID=A0A8C2XFX8_CYCLU